VVRIPIREIPAKGLSFQPAEPNACMHSPYCMTELHALYLNPLVLKDAKTKPYRQMGPVERLPL
jgi:hypothetical protein